MLLAKDTVGQAPHHTFTDSRELDCDRDRLQVVGQFEQAFQLVDSLLDSVYKSKVASSLEGSCSSLYSALESAQIGVVFVTLEGRVAYFNQKFADMWQVPPGVLQTQKHSQYVAYCQSQSQKPDAFCVYVEQLDSQPYASGITTIELKDNRIFEQFFQPQYLEGQLIGRVWGYIETTQMNLSLDGTRAKLNPWAARFSSWADITDTIILIASDGQLSYANPAAETLTGYSQQEILEHPQFNDWIACLQQPSPQKGEHELITKQGEACWLQFSTREFCFDDRSFFLLNATDVTALKQREYNLRQLLVSESELRQSRLQLTASITHRSLGALNFISMSADLLERYEALWDEARKKTYLHRIKSALQQLNQFIGKLEDVCKLSIDKSAIESAPIDAYKVCCDLVEDFKCLHQQHAFVSLNTTSTAQANLNKNLLQTILANLLENASKYSPEASLIKVVLVRKADSIIFQVHDQGIGVPLLECDKLFDPFYRGSNVGDIEGIGMGLTIAKALLDTLGGQINFASQVNNGSIVTVRLPLSHPAYQSQLA